MALKPKYKLELIIALSPSLLSDCLMLDNTLVRLLLTHPTSMTSQKQLLKMLQSKVSKINASIFILSFHVYSPSSISCNTNNISNPIRPIGSSITLICSVELSPAVDIPVTVNTEWSGPGGVTILLNDTIMQNHTVYISTAVIKSFGRQQSGNYSCSASINPTSPESFLVSSATTTGTTRITVGKRPRTKNFIMT